MMTGGLIQVFPANRAKSLAVFAAKRADWNSQEHFLPHQRCEINLPGFRHEQPRFGDRMWGKSIQFGKIDAQGLGEIGQAAHAFGHHFSLHPDLHQQPLGRACDAGCTQEIIKAQVRQTKRRDFQRKIPTVADRLVDYKPDIKPEEIV